MSNLFAVKLKRFYPSLFFVFILTFLIASLKIVFAVATPQGSTESLLSVIPPETALQNSTHVVAIEDFNNHGDTPLESRGWQIFATAPENFAPAWDSTDGRSLLRGKSLKLPITFQKKEDYILMNKELGNLDISKAEHFAFKTKVVLQDSNNRKLRVKVTLRDRLKEGAESKEVKFKQDDLWREISFKLSEFKKLDLNGIQSVGIEISSADGLANGSLWLDELAFVGPEEVNFLSARDNIVGFPKKSTRPNRQEQLTKIQDDELFLWEIAKDTWEYFKNTRDKSNRLILDNIKVSESKVISGYTSPTNIGLDLIAWVSAVDMGFEDKKDAVEEIRKVFETMKELPKDEGLFYNFYETKDGSITRQYISSVDNGWLGIGLVVVRQAFHEDLYEEATEFLNAMDFDRFLDHTNNHLSIGYEMPFTELDQNHYGLLVSEARATSLLAIGKGDVSPEHWWFLYRTLPEAWKWQNQEPLGEFVNEEGIEYFQGFYKKGSQKFVPSWGGSLFEYLMPTIVLKERDLAPNSLGFNNRVVTVLHKNYALKEKGYSVWGISPCASSNGSQWKYLELGVKSLSVKGYDDKGVITPHVSFLALDSLPKEAIKNIRKLLEYEGIYGEYGFYDSVQVDRERVHQQYLALDQGMIFAAINNYINEGAIQERFHQDSIGENAEKILMKESFFKE